MTDSTLAPEAGAADDYLGDMTVVASFGNVQEAQTLKGCLEAAGISTTLGDVQTVQTNMLWATALGGVRVMVPRALLPRAKEVIAEYDAGAFAIEGDPDPALPPAPIATDLRLWHPDIAALFALWFTPVLGAGLHWHNSRTLADRGLARQADVGLAPAIVATAVAAWLLRGQEWSVGMAFKVSGVAAPFTALWYLAFAHSQSRFIARSFGRKYVHRPIGLVGALAFGSLLAIGLVGSALN